MMRRFGPIVRSGTVARVGAPRPTTPGLSISGGRARWSAQSRRRSTRSRTAALHCRAIRSNAERDDELIDAAAHRIVRKFAGSPRW